MDLAGQWTEMPRATRRRRAVLLTLESLVVTSVAGYSLARITGDDLAWVAAAGTFAWFAMFLFVLVRSPRTGPRWALLALPVMLLATTAAYVILRART